MGSVVHPFGRNVEFEATFPELSEDEIVRNRHAERLGPLQPDPQVISRKLFTRAQPPSAKCNDGRGATNNSPEANCAYRMAAHVNLLAAFWIQFMTHDWFSHLEECHNTTEMMPMWCNTPNDTATSRGRRPGARMDKRIVAEERPAPRFTL